MTEVEKTYIITELVSPSRAKTEFQCETTWEVEALLAAMIAASSNYFSPVRMLHIVLKPILNPQWERFKLALKQPYIVFPVLIILTIILSNIVYPYHVFRVFYSPLYI